jgi:hypothetical protein
VPKTEVPLLALVSDLVTWLKSWQVPWMVIGGVAASLLGRPRLTRDLDVLVALHKREWPKFLRSAVEQGFAPTPVEAIELAHQTQGLGLCHEASGLTVNLVFASLDFEHEALARATWVDLGEVQLPLPSPEDLIIMKAVGHRPRDLADIEAILAAHPQLKLWWMLDWVQKFAAALEMPELLTDLEALLNQRRQSPETGR